jgi:hypothetical protein
MPIFKKSIPYTNTCIYSRDKNNIKAYAKLKSDFISSNNADTDLLSLMTLMYKKNLIFPMNYIDFNKKKHLLYKYLLKNHNVILIFISDEIEIAFKYDYNNEDLLNIILNVIKDT